MLNVVILGVVMLGVVMLGVVMQNVVEPSNLNEDFFAPNPKLDAAIFFPSSLKLGRK